MTAAPFRTPQQGFPSDTPQGRARRRPHAGPSPTHFRWLSVRVMPWADTLKCTTVDTGGGSCTRVRLRAFCTAWCPVSDSISTEFKYHTLQAAREQGGHWLVHSPNGRNSGDGLILNQGIRDGFIWVSHVTVVWVLGPFPSASQALTKPGPEAGF